jgi:hypothetical protein
MLALRDGARDADQLAATTGLAQADVKDVLELLAALEYVTGSQGVYTAVVPVLTERDRPMVAELRRLGRQATVKWFDERYPSLRAELAALTPGRFGVPLSHSFSRIWHHVFAIANRELVAAGLVPAGRAQPSAVEWNDGTSVRGPAVAGVGVGRLQAARGPGGLGGPCRVHGRLVRPAIRGTRGAAGGHA